MLDYTSGIGDYGRPAKDIDPLNYAEICVNAARMGMATCVELAIRRCLDMGAPLPRAVLLQALGNAKSEHPYGSMARTRATLRYFLSKPMYGSGRWDN